MPPSQVLIAGVVDVVGIAECLDVVPEDQRHDCPASHEYGDLGLRFGSGWAGFFQVIVLLAGVPLVGPEIEPVPLREIDPALGRLRLDHRGDQQLAAEVVGVLDVEVSSGRPGGSAPGGA